MEPHRIRRAILKVRAGSAAKAFDVRSAVRAELMASIFPAMERAFDRVAPEETVTRIGRLEVRLTLFSVETLANELPALLEQALYEELQTQQHDVDKRRVSDASRAAAASSPPNVSVTSSEEERRSALQRYLQSGLLPWSQGGVDVDPRRTPLLPPSLADVAVIVREAEPVQPTDRVLFYARLLQLVPERDWPRLAEAFGGPMGTRAIIDALDGIVDASRWLARYARLRLAAAAWSIRGCEPPSQSAGQVVSSVVDELGKVGASSLPAVHDLFARFLPSAGATPPGTSGTASTALQTRGESRPLRQSAENADLVRAHVGEGPPHDDPAMRDEIRPFGLTVAHAGLALVHPFLPRYFQARGIQFSATPSDRELARAAALLQLLATGEDEAPEFDLPFIKVLLGLPIDYPLTVASGLTTEADRVEGGALLGSVIEHWRVLQTTSIDNLRAAFLQRRGLLYDEDRQYRLQVAGAAFDVLLARLPWAINVIKLPWMSKPLFTEWSPA